MGKGTTCSHMCGCCVGGVLSPPSSSQTLTMPPPQALTICKRALKLAKGRVRICGPKPTPPTPLTADYRSRAVQARPHTAHIGPDTRCDMRAATKIARVAATPPTL